MASVRGWSRSAAPAALASVRPGGHSTRPGSTVPFEASRPALRSGGPIRKREPRGAASPTDIRRSSAMSNTNRGTSARAGGGNAVYGLGFIGALVYYIQVGHGLWGVVLGIL